MSRKFFFINILNFVIFKYKKLICVSNKKKVFINLRSCFETHIHKQKKLRHF